MDFTAFITVLTTVLSIVVKVVGMPSQIKQNHQRKSTAGLSDWFMITTLVSYVLWVIHGVQVHDTALVIGQGLGTVVTAVIVAQMYMYHGDQPKKDETTHRPPLLWFTAMQTGVLHKGAGRREAATKSSRA